jgi:hypothetical protein
MEIGKARRGVLVVALIVVLGLLVPYPKTIAPEWTVYTLDASRRPLANITVSESWQQYSVEAEGHEERAKTDANGRVSFPRRYRWSSLAQRLFGCAKNVVMYGVHASCGAHSHLVAFGDHVDTMDWEDPEQEDGMPILVQRSVLVLKKK